MPKTLNKFAGHMRSGDPRTPVFAAGGCPWPTIPPYRWVLTSSDATRMYAPFNGASILFECEDANTRHDLAVWRVVDQPWWLYDAVIEKHFIRDQYPNYRYWVTILMTLRGIDEIAVANRHGRCNENVHLGNQIGGPLRGNVGNTFRMLQIEYNQTEPP